MMVNCNCNNVIALFDIVAEYTMSQISWSTLLASYQLHSGEVLFDDGQRFLNVNVVDGR